MTAPPAAQMTVDAFRGAVGRRRDELETPALILDLDVARANIDRMAEFLADKPVKLRPHAKLHKSPRIARMQVDAGAIGISCATAWEAIAMAEAGIEDVLVANQVVGPGKTRALVEACARSRITVAVDSEANLDQLSAAAVAAGQVLGVLVEIDVGMGRCGVRSRDEALRVAQHAVRLPGIEFRGVQGYEGHCMLEPDRELRVQKQAQAMADVGGVIDHLAAHGLGCEIVSAGGTGTYDLTGINPRVTELQAGSYVFMDAFHNTLIPGFPVALTVLLTVMSRHGTRVILDGGMKAVGTDLMLPTVAGHDAETVFVAEEHTGIDVPEDSPLRIGDTVEVLPGYGPTTVNRYGVYHIVEDGVVTDIWPVLSRYGTESAVERPAVSPA
jgi:D-serine deaminase-like pyridoxal phosphate-dependent protein